MANWNMSNFRARYAGTCYTCNQRYEPGVSISLVKRGTARGRRGGNKYAHVSCQSKVETVEIPDFNEVQSVERNYDDPIDSYQPLDKIEKAEKTEKLKTYQPDPIVESVRKSANESEQNDLGRIIAKAVEQYIPKSQIDPAQIEKTVDSKLAKLKSEILAAVEETVTGPAPVISVTLENSVEPKKVEGAHFLLPRLLKLLSAGLPLYLWGKAGTGKSTAAMQAALILEIESEIDTLDPSTFRSMIQGYCTPTGTPVHTSFTRCWTEGKVYIAEECDNAPGHVQTLFNTALANGHAPLAWGNAARNKNFRFIANGNTPGRPVPEFPDRRPMSAAFMDRLYFVHWPLDPAIECRAAGLPCPKAPERVVVTCTPAEWVKWVQRLRKWAAKEIPTLSITPRASLDGLKALAAGESVNEVADGLVFRGADSAIVEKALSAVPLP